MTPPLASPTDPDPRGAAADMDQIAHEPPLLHRARPDRPAARFVGRLRGPRPQSLICLMLGAVAGLGFAPLEWWPLTIIAVTGWMALVHQAPTLRAASWRGWLFGLGHFTVNDNWIGHAFDFQANMPTWLGYAAPPLLALYLAVFPALAAGLAWLASPRSLGDRATPPRWSYALTFAAAWIATEYLRATMFTGYAWDPLGVIWVPVQPVASLAAWVGTYALSGLTVAGAGALLLAMGARWPARVVAATVLVVLIGMQMVSYLPITPVSPGADHPRVRVVQPDIGQDERGETDGELMVRTLSRLSGRPGHAPRLLLWPEGVVRDSLEDGYPARFYVAPDSAGGWAFHPPAAVRRRLARLLGPRDILLTGGDALQFTPEGDLKTAANSVFAITPPARLLGRYDKAHLVPYGEYLPMRPLLSAIGLSRLVPGDVDFVPGPGPRALALPGFGAIGVQLCYEIVFSGEVVNESHRPRAIFNPSNDAWFGSWGPPQHLAQARMRAIEEGLPILRATPTGVSAIIGADGTVLAALPHDRAGAIETPLPAPLPPTLFSRAGNWMAAIVTLALALLAVASRRRRR